MTQAPPVPAANQSPYPIQEPPHPPSPPRPPRAPEAPDAGVPWLALLGAGAIAVIGGVLLSRRR
jgi:LPXTG-motif cell wall-anchored protein